MNNMRQENMKNQIISNNQLTGHKKKQITNLSIMNQCHLCRLMNNQSSQQTPIFMATCCMKRCYKNFCLACIHKKFDEDFQQAYYKSDTWICYSCQNKCSCIICRGIGSEKKSSKKRAGQLPTKQQIRLDAIKQQAVEDYYSPEQLNSAAPFMKRILQRRNHMFKLMVNASQKNQILKSTTNLSEKQSIMLKSQTFFKDDESVSKNIKQMIKQTLKDYEEDDDIELIN